MDATARFVAIVAVAAFVTERIVAVIDYLINMVRGSGVPANVGAQAPPREWRKLALFFIAALIAYVVVEVAHLRLLTVLQVGNVDPRVDFWLTWLVVVAGADRVRSMLGGDGGGSDDASQDRSDTPVVHVQIDGGEARELKRVQ
jgi:hypothetical protein